MTLQELKAQEAELSALLKENQAAQNEILKAEFIATNQGIDIGDTISFLDKGFECVGIISKIEVGSAVSYYFINPIKKDGTRGKLEIRLWANEMKTLQLVSKKIIQK